MNEIECARSFIYMLDFKLFKWNTYLGKGSV